MGIETATRAPTDVTGHQANQNRQPDTSEVVPSGNAATSTDDAISPKLAILARKEKALRRMSQELKAEKEALKAKEADYASGYVPKKVLAERFQQDPLSVMNEFGVSYDQLTNALLNQPGPQDVAMQKLQAKIQQLEETQKQSLSQAEENSKREYQQAVNQIRTDVKLLVDGDANFETIKDTNNVEAVVELIRETFDQEGVILSIEDAAKEVEIYLIEEGLKMARLKKIQAKLTPEPASEPSVPEKTLHTSTLKTLTNAQTTSSKPLTPRERRERAILAFRGQLK